MDMEQARAGFAQYLQRRFRGSSTPKHYLNDLDLFLSTLSQTSPETVTAAEMDAFVDRQIAAGLKPTTINRRVASLHTFFEYWASQQADAEWPNPVQGQRHHLKIGSHLPRDLPDQEVVQFFGVIASQRDRAMFGLMVGAGLRVREVAELRVGNVEAPTQPDQLAKVRVRGKGQKERIVWLTPSLWETLQAWLHVRPPVETDRVFLNQQAHPISVAGIQYCLQQHAQAAGVKLSCHRLRHTFARRLAEQGLPVDSLAKLLGHSQLQTTQRYIDGADPTVRADFATAMAQLEATSLRDRGIASAPPKPSPPPQPRTAPQAELLKLRERLTTLPAWLREAVDAYLSWRWPTWRGQTAYRQGINLVCLIQRFWDWLAAHRHVEGWKTFQRADLEAWLQARGQAEVSEVTIRNDLGQLRSVLRFLEAHSYPLAASLFRVQLPRRQSEPLPRYLPEAEYQRLETLVLNTTQTETYAASFDRAWFLTLAHTGLRLSELLDLRLGDLNLTSGYATVRGGKPGRDRVVYLTPSLVTSLKSYLGERPDVSEDDHLFLLHGRVPTDRTIQRRLTDFGQQAGVAVSPHRLRHTLATRLVNQGMPIHSLRKLLGHQHLNITLLYARIYDETLYEQFKTAMSQLEAIPVDDWPNGATLVEAEQDGQTAGVSEGKMGFANSV